MNKFFPVKERDAVRYIPQELCRALKRLTSKERLQRPMAWRALLDLLTVWTDTSDSGWGYHSLEDHTESGGWTEVQSF